MIVKDIINLVERTLDHRMYDREGNKIPMHRDFIAKVIKSKHIRLIGDTRANERNYLITADGTTKQWDLPESISSVDRVYVNDYQATKVHYDDFLRDEVELEDE